jgi:hypothetical protein
MKRARVWMTVMAAALLVACGDDAASSGGSGAGGNGAGGNGAGGGATTTSGGLCPGVDLESDPENCGACGNDCGGGACTNGTCGAFELVTLPGFSTTLGTIAAIDTHLYVSGGPGLFVVDLSDRSVTTVELPDAALGLDAYGAHATYCLAGPLGNSLYIYQGGSQAGTVSDACGARLGAGGLFYIRNDELIRSSPEGGGTTTLRTYAGDSGTGFDFEYGVGLAPLPSGGVLGVVSRFGRAGSGHELEKIDDSGTSVVADYGLSEPESLAATESSVYFTIYSEGSQTLNFARTRLSDGATDLLQSSTADFQYELDVHVDGSTAYLIDPLGSGSADVYVIGDGDTSPTPLDLGEPTRIADVATNAQRLYALTFDGTIVSAPKPN